MNIPIWMGLETKRCNLPGQFQENVREESSRLANERGDVTNTARYLAQNSTSPISRETGHRRALTPITLRDQGYGVVNILGQLWHYKNRIAHVTGDMSR